MNWNLNRSCQTPVKSWVWKSYRKKREKHKRQTFVATKSSVEDKLILSQAAVQCQFKQLPQSGRQRSQSTITFLIFYTLFPRQATELVWGVQEIWDDLFNLISNLPVYNPSRHTHTHTRYNPHLIMKWWNVIPFDRQIALPQWETWLTILKTTESICSWGQVCNDFWEIHSVNIFYNKKHQRTAVYIVLHHGSHSGVMYTWTAASEILILG